MRDSTLIVCVLENPDKREFLTQGMIAIENKEIVRLKLAGKSNIQRGMAIGGLAGAIFGTWLGLQSSPGDEGSFILGFNFNKFLIPFAGLLRGLIVGGIVGLGSSISDEEFVALISRYLLLLKSRSRYPDKEPDFLKSFL